MQICNDADLGTEYSFPQNQNITGKAPRLLPCSSIASCPDQGSDLITTSQTGEEKEYPDHKWYYMFLRNRELKRYIEIFTGRRAVMINTRSGIKEERYFCFKVFSYTSADHKRRFERCPYSKEEYAARRESAFAVKEAFATGSVQKLNALTDEKEITGDGYLFVCTPLDELNLILAHLFPRQYLAKDRNLPHGISSGQRRLCHRHRECVEVPLYCRSVRRRCFCAVLPGIFSAYGDSRHDDGAGGRTRQPPKRGARL